MGTIDQKICAWGGPLCAALLGTGLLMSHFVPPPAPSLSADQVALFYQTHGAMIRVGMIIGLGGIAGFLAQIGVISTQMSKMRTGSKLPEYLQLGAGSVGVLTVMFPVMIFAICAFRPERDPALTQAINDAGWLIIIPAYPTFIAQFGAIAMGCLLDTRRVPIYPRWVGYFNIWIALLFMPGALAFILKTGPFAWNGLLSFWLASSAFFGWLLVMTPMTLKAIALEDEIDAAPTVRGRIREAA